MLIILSMIVVFILITVFASMTASFAQASEQQGATGGAELDEVKRMLTDTNPWFLALTAAVSVLHMLFVLQS
jgi:ABC-type cobalt transport system substrate-binding protein